MLKSKKLLVLAIIFLISSQLFAIQNPTEGYLYAEIKSELVSKAYPTVLESAQFFIETYSQSIYLDDVQLCYGEAQFYAGQNAEAKEVLQQSYKSQDAEIQSASQYWLGRIAFKTGNFAKAANYFYSVVNGNKSEDNLLVTSSWLYAGKSLYELNEYGQAEKVFRYYLATFSADKQYQEISRLLCASYYQTKDYQTLIAFYNTIPLGSFSIDSQEICKIYAAGSYLALKNYQKAYLLYTQLLGSANNLRALASLQRAYSIVIINDFATEQELLNLASEYLGTESENMQNLWVRSGISAFQEGDFESALHYFERSDTTGNKVGELWDLSAFYQAKTYMHKNNLEKALTILKKRYVDTSFLAPWFLTAEAAVSAQNEDWVTCSELAGQAIKKLEDLNSAEFALYNEALYWKGVALYAQKKMAEAVMVLAKTTNNEKGGVTTLLYAQSLFTSGERKKASELFTSYFPENKDTAIALLKTGDYLGSWKTAVKAGDLYISGLDAYCLSDWDQASNSFQQALLNDSVSGDKKSWANYYYADSLYHQGEYAKALARFALFLKSWNVHLKSWDAKMNAAKCAIQINSNKMADEAIAYVLDASKMATTDEQKIESAILGASLYTDAERYDDAEEILVPLAKSYLPNSVPVRFQLANIYAADGQLEAADSELQKISEVFKTSDFAREAAYRRGEIYYRVGNYTVATEKFADFRQNWQQGTFSDAALFFGAESTAKSGNVGRAILLYNDVIKRYPNGTYTFASMGALITLYRANEEYQDALDVAGRLLIQYGEQARNAGVAAEIAELNLLISGGDEQATQLYADWVKNNKNNTEQGRETGFNLASRYISITEKKAEGIQMLNDLRESLESLNSKKNVDTSLYARILEQQAKIERDSGSAKKAADFYVKAAERYAETGYSDSREKAARAMYGAVEAFSAARKYADSKAVYITMKDSFADSEWTVKAAKIIE